MSKAKKNIIYILAFILPVVAAVFLIYKMNAITLSRPVLQNAGTVTQSVINQSLFIFGLEVYAMMLMLCFNRYFSKLKIVMLSFVVGVLVWCLSSAVIVCVGIPFRWYTVVTLCIAVLAAAYFGLKPRKLSKEERIFYIKAIALYVSFAFFFASLCVFRFSYDSYMYINTGQKIAKLGYLPQELISVVSGFSLFTPMLFAPSEFFGFDFSQGVYLLVNVQFTVFVGFAIYEEVKNKLGEKKGIIAGAVSLLAIVSSNIYFELIYWPLSNLLTAMTMFGLIYFTWKAEKEHEGINMLLSAFFGVCFVLIRTENMLLYICFMFLVSLESIKQKALALHLGAAAAALALWYVRFFAVAGLDFSEGAFLTVERAAGVIGILVLFVLYVLILSKTAFFKKREKLIEKLFFAAMTAAIALLSVLNPDFFAETLKATIYNVFYDGAWAGSLLIAFAIYFAKFYYVKGANYFDKRVLVFLLFYFIIFLLRSMSLRIGYGDSGNRYFAHILPIIVFSIAVSFTEKLIHFEQLQK